MKHRNQFFISIVFIIFILGIALFTSFTSEQEPDQVFPAKVNRDCAPWDGSAFTIAIQYDPRASIIISIWQSPDIPYRSTFSFPDNSSQVGNAYLAPALSSYALLQGEATLRGVSLDKPIEGSFNFESERGYKFEGQFIAEWGDGSVMCG